MPKASLVLAVLSTLACGTSCSSRESEPPAAPIAFQRDQELVLIDPDGSNERTLADFRGELGDAIVIDDVGDGDVYHHAIWVVTLDGKARRMPLGKAFGHPMWSPDGTKIAYDGPDAPSFLADPWIYVMNADGSARRRVTNGWLSSWAPRKSIGFLVGDDLWIVNADSSGRRRATETEEALEFGTVSPDGRMITEDKDNDLYVRDLTTGATRKLTKNIDYCCVSWSPDGKSLAFVGYSRPFGGYRPGDIYVVNADGTDARNLTVSAENESSPVWSPRG